MAKYQIEATKVIAWIVEIEADSTEHALELTREWDAQDFEEVGEEIKSGWTFETTATGWAVVCGACELSELELDACPNSMGDICNACCACKDRGDH